MFYFQVLLSLVLQQLLFNGTISKNIRSLGITKHEMYFFHLCFL